jgi:hypothetical protein
MDPTSRLRIATRIHYALMRQLGSGIDVGHMLKREDYAREVLYVCEGSGDPELMSLARKFALASIEATLADSRPSVFATAPAPLDSTWSAPSTSFGATGLGELGGPSDKTPSRWLNPSRWLGLDSPDSVH